MNFDFFSFAIGCALGYVGTLCLIAWVRVREDQRGGH